MLSAKIKKIEIKNGKTILRNVSFEVEAGKVYTIVGKNGTGKTTLIKALTNLLPANIYAVEGEVIFEGNNLLDLNNAGLQSIRKSKIKYVFQDAINSFDPLKTFKYYFDSVNNFENSHINKNEIEELLEYFILPEREALYKLYPYEASGGTAQRIGFVLALLAHPEIIILDEPTSGIDAAIANLYIEKIRKFVNEKERSVLLVTHDLNFAMQISDKIAFISDDGISDFLSTNEFFISADYPALKSFLDSYKQLMQ